MNNSDYNNVGDYLYNKCANDEIIDGVLLMAKSLYKLPFLGHDGDVKLRLAIYITHVFGMGYACHIRFGETKFSDGLFTRFKELIQSNTEHIPEMCELVFEVIQEYHNQSRGKNIHEISKIVGKSYAGFLNINDMDQNLERAASNVFVTIVDTADRYITEITESQQEFIKTTHQMSESEIYALMKEYFAKRDFSSMKLLWESNASKANILKVNTLFALAMQISNEKEFAYKVLSTTIKYYRTGYLFQHYNKHTLYDYALCHYNCTEIGETIKNISNEQLLIHYSNALFYFRESFELLKMNEFDDTDKNNFGYSLISRFALQNSFIGDLCMKPLFDKLYKLLMKDTFRFSRYHCAYISYGLVRMTIERVYKSFTGNPSESILKKELDKYFIDSKNNMELSSKLSNGIDTDELIVAQSSFNDLIDNLRQRSKTDPFFENI